MVVSKKIFINLHSFPKLKTLRKIQDYSAFRCLRIMRIHKYNIKLRIEQCKDYVKFPNKI